MGGIKVKSVNLRGAWSAEVGSLVASERAGARGTAGLSGNMMQPESSEELVLGDTWRTTINTHR